MQSLRAKNKDHEIMLWLSFLAGEKDAFALFYKFNYRKLYSYGLNIGMPKEQVKDSIQELFIKLFIRPDLIKDCTKILPFLFQSIKNAFIDYQRYSQKYLIIEENYDFNFSYTIETGSVEDIEEKEHIKDQIDQIIKSLTPRQKEIIYLRFLYHMEYEDISKIMNISEQAARNLTHTGQLKNSEITTLKFQHYSSFYTTAVQQFNLYKKNNLKKRHRLITKPAFVRNAL